VDYQNKPSNKREDFIEAPLEFRNLEKEMFLQREKLGENCHTHLSTNTN